MAELLTIGQVMTLTGWSQSTVYKYLKEGRLTRRKEVINAKLVLMLDADEVNSIKRRTDQHITSSEFARLAGVSRKAVSDHCRSAGVTNSYIPELSNTYNLIDEGNLYRLMIKSSKPEAEPFESYVCDDVLPSIRKTGSYSVADKAKKEPSIDIAKLTKTNKHLLALAKQNGLKGNQAIISADRATEWIEGYSPLKILNLELLAPVKEKIITPTEVGMQLGGLSPQKVNKLLEEKGFQEFFIDGNQNKQWGPTEKGKPFGEMVDTAKKHVNGSPVKQWKWYESIVDQLRAI